MSFSKFGTCSTPALFWTQQNSHRTASCSTDRALPFKTKLFITLSYSLRNSWFSGTPWSEKFLLFQGLLGSKMLQIYSIQMPHPKFMVMVSFCWKVNFLPSKIENRSVLLTMSLKLMTKVVGFFLGHPVYIYFKQGRVGCILALLIIEMNKFYL